MINKKTLPILVLVLVSIGAVIFALGFLWMLDADSPTIAEQAASTLRLGIPSGIVLIVLIWFGAGIDALLSRIKTGATRVLVSLGVYIVLPATLCIGLPVLLISLFTLAAFPEGGYNADFGMGLMMTLAAIPAVIGFLFIYVGAGANFLSRKLADRLWREEKLSTVLK